MKNEKRLVSHIAKNAQKSFKN